MTNAHYILVLCIVFLLPSCGTTQKNGTTLLKSNFDITENIVDIQIDNLQNIYILTKENKVVKYTDTFEKQYEYSNNLIGEIKSIDATNPQKILCFVKDFNRILVLDNTLAEINKIDLSTSEYLDVSAICRSNDNRIWIFDPINQILVKIDDQMESQYQSNRLTDLNLGMIEPIMIKERGNIVAISDPNIGILIFDNFGQFLRLVPEKEIDNFQIFGDYLFFTQNEKYFQYHIVRFEKSELTKMERGYGQFIIAKSNTYYIEAFGRPLAKLGQNYDIIAECRIEIEQARLLCLKAAWMMDQGDARAAAPWISKIKVAAPNMEPQLYL